MLKRNPSQRSSPPGREGKETDRSGAANPETERQLGSTRVLSEGELLSAASKAGPGKTSAGKAPSGKAPHQTHHEEDTAIVSPAPDPADLSVLGDFQILKKIGEGAMGAVYKARQISYNREVALKVLFPHVANNPKLVERLYREGQVMNQLEHPNIVHAYAQDEDQGYHFIAMEFVDGESLQKWLNRLGRLELADALNIALTVARALGHAHDQGLVHRDIKPDNVLITRQGLVKVADFGMVKTADDAMHLTQTGHAVGTPWYMPLEQAKNAKDVDGRCDIYALGCVLYCMLTGNPPFVGRTIVEVIQAKEGGTFATARSANPDVPERLDLILAKMTAKQARYRYQNCAELIQDLESLNLAGKKLQFLDGKVPQRKTGPKAPRPAPGSIETNPDVWFVNITHTDGGTTLSKLSTQEIKKMLEDGSLQPTVRASHQPTEAFRALATYKEFQGSALSKASRQGGDAQGARFRSLMKKIEEKDRARDEKNSSQERKTDPRANYWHTLWLPSLYVAGGILVLFFLWYVATGLVK